MTIPRSLAIYAQKLLLRFVTLYAMLSSSLYAEFTPTLSRADANLCAVHVYQHERLKKIPSHLLAAISKVESGRYMKETKQVIAWPWTINVQGKDFYFPTKTEAVTHVKKLLNQGITSIDVGCMQVNLHHHPQAFESIEDAFDPRTNTEYAAKFLTNLKNSLGSWNMAVAHYHSANAEHHIPYRKKVYETWLKERKTNTAPTLLNSDMAYGQYTVSYGSQGKIYRNASLEELRARRQNDPQWRLNEARFYLMQYRNRAKQALKNTSQTIPVQQQTKNSPTSATGLVPSAKASLTRNVIQRASRLPSPPIKQLNTTDSTPLVTAVGVADLTLKRGRLIKVKTE